MRMSRVRQVWLTSTPCARSVGLNRLFTTTLISMCCRELSLTSGMTRNGSVMSLVVRYLSKIVTARSQGYRMRAVRRKGEADLINSYCPSGGIKLILLSLSNLLSFTHWWNVQSSIATPALELCPDLKNEHEYYLYWTANSPAQF